MGAIQLLFGTAVCYFSIWLPISGAQARVESVYLHMGLTVIGLGALFSGGAYVIFGRPFVEAMYMPREEWSQEFTTKFYGVLAVAIAVAILLEIYVYNMGYARRR